MRSTYAFAVGQWLQVKMITNARVSAKSFSAYIRPSTPGSLKSGAGSPIANALNSSGSAVAGPDIREKAARAIAGRTRTVRTVDSTRPRGARSRCQPWVATTPKATRAAGRAQQIPDPRTVERHR